MLGSARLERARSACRCSGHLPLVGISECAACRSAEASTGLHLPGCCAGGDERKRILEPLEAALGGAQHPAEALAGRGWASAARDAEGMDRCALLPAQTAAWWRRAMLGCLPLMLCLVAHLCRVRC